MVFFLVYESQVLMKNMLYILDNDDFGRYINKNSWFKMIK